MNVAEYNRCVEDHSDGLYRFVIKNLKDPDASHDVVQDTFEKLWIKRDTVDYAKSKSYLFTTAYHKLIDYVRKNKRSTSMEEVHEHSKTSSNQYSDLSELLTEALDRLPSDQKAVLMLRDYEGYNYEEIGEICGLSLSQVKVYIFRARTAMKKYLVSIDAVL